MPGRAGVLVMDVCGKYRGDGRPGRREEIERGLARVACPGPEGLRCPQKGRVRFDRYLEWQGGGGVGLRQGAEWPVVRPPRTRRGLRWIRVSALVEHRAGEDKGRRAEAGANTTDFAPALRE